MEQDKIIALYGGEAYQVNRPDGTQEEVKICQLPVRRALRILELMNDEPALVELYCQKEEGWADTLTVDDYEYIAERGMEINHPTLSRYADRQARAGKGITQLMTQAMEEVKKAFESGKQ